MIRLKREWIEGVVKVVLDEPAVLVVHVGQEVHRVSRRDYPHLKVGDLVVGQRIELPQIDSRPQMVFLGQLAAKGQQVSLAFVDDDQEDQERVS